MRLDSFRTCTAAGALLGALQQPDRNLNRSDFGNAFVTFDQQVTVINGQ